MPQVSARRWVVLVQRKPRGPMGEPEVQALLNKGIVRTNDLAFEVSPDTGKALTDWKMLWQFTEFDRRAKKLAEEKAKAGPGPTTIERRGPVTAEKIQAKVKEAIPEELLDITPEDLIPKQNSGQAKLLREEEIEAALSSPDVTNRSGALYRWAAIGVVGLLTLGIVNQWLSSPSSSKPRAQIEESDNRDIANPPKSSGERPKFTHSLPGGDRAKPSTSVTPPSAREEANEPVRRDRGTIPFDSTREREEDQYADEDDAVPEDSATESRKGSGKKRVKRVPVAEEGEEAIEPREPANENSEEVD